ncbi:phospholipase D-like domain-containing protein [Streptomyces qinglanensis]|uniref:phospholipase D n=1 Tax=Streptomyces qinglanensis TaxID=943816 RepID=A0A1H9UB29_9ACTN|nr:phospholipase D-like domain-containing protein [Streptomyces qinglanensis]SES06471.1 Phosphatidylserine/phosphatidylglycerophosphate/cardiolipin synthase [Streptomyces qinglanensis]
MTHSRTAAAPLALLLCTGLHLAAPSPAAAAPPGTGPGTGPVFNQPDGTAAQQRAIRSDLLARIKAAAPRSTIKVALYHFWDAEVARALAAAHTAAGRRVRVRVLLDASSVSAMPSSTSYGILRKALGTDRSKRSFVALCPEGKSCLGKPGAGPSIAHNKFWLFSHTGGLRNVVVQTSSNLSTGSYTKFWNDELVVSQARLHAAYSRYFDKAAAADWRGWRYTRTGAAPYTGYFFPRPNGGDTVRALLDNVTCRWSDARGSHRTSVRLAMFKLTRQGVADKLAELQRQGCAVDIVYAESDSEDSTGAPGTWEALHAPGGPAVRCLHYDDDGDPATSREVVHSKTLLISGRYAGATGALVWTGSHNYSGPALTKNDETLLKVDDPVVHDAYLRRFLRLRAAARPGLADDTPRCKGVSPQPED